MSKLRLISPVVLAVALAIAPSSAVAQGRGHGHAKPDKKHNGPTHSHDAPAHEAVAFDRDGHVRVIHEYAHAGTLPPGLAKRQSLPPGLRAQIHERGALPPGLQKRLIAVPAPLATRLPPVPPYYHRYFAGDDLVVLDDHTHRIVAFVPDVWR